MGFMAAQVAPTCRVSDRPRGCLLASVTSNSRELDVGDVDERSRGACKARSSMSWSVLLSPKRNAIDCCQTPNHSSDGPWQMITYSEMAAFYPRTEISRTAHPKITMTSFEKGTVYSSTTSNASSMQGESTCIECGRSLMVPPSQGPNDATSAQSQGGRRSSNDV